MDTVDKYLSTALSSVCGCECLELHPDLTCMTRKIQIKKKKSNVSVSCATWRPKHSVFFTLVKVKKGTLVYCHANCTTYYASPQAQLARECPDNTIFLAQWCMDHQNVPRLLIFDVLGPEPRVAVERGNLLRNMSHLFPQPLCVVQWVGEPEALEDDFTSQLPHPVDYVFGLDDEPLVLHRILKVKIPPNIPGGSKVDSFLLL